MTTVSPAAPGLRGSAPNKGRAGRRLRLDTFSLIGLPLVVALLLLIVVPLANAVIRSFTGPAGIDLSALNAVLADTAFGTAFTNTLIVIGVSGTSAIILASLFAWLNERTDGTLGVVSSLAPIMPLLIPPVAMSIGWVFLAQSFAGFLNGFLRGVLAIVGVQLTSGPLDIGSWPGMLFLYTIALVPFAYVVITPAFRNLDASMEEASRMSGAGPIRTALRISLPLIGPAILSAWLMVVIIGAALYSIPAIVGSMARIQTLSVYIVNLTSTSSAGMTRAVAAAMVLVVFLAGVWALQRWIISRQRQLTISGKTVRGATIRLGRWRRPAQALNLAYFMAVAVLPLAALVIVALQPFWTATIDPSKFKIDAITNFFTSNTNKLPREALSTSLRLGAVGATLVLLSATILVTFAHHSGRVMANFIRGVTKIPSAISGLVIAVAILFTFAGPPLSLKGSFLILLLAYLVMFMPQASIAAEAARGQVGDDLLEASHMAGASRLRTSIRILWPLMRPGLVYGWAMIFVLILGDLIAASVLAGSGNQVVGSAIIEIYVGGIFRDLVVLSMIVTILALVVVGLAVTVFSRRPGQSKGGGTTSGPAAPTIAS